MNNSPVTISVILPVYNEGNSFAGVVGEVISSLDEARMIGEIILVDDGSSDNTWAEVRRLSEAFPNIRGIRFSRNFGKEYAVAAGLETAVGDAVIVMDADGQHPPSLIPEMIRIWQASDADIVDARKTDRRRESFFSKLSAGIFYVLWNRLSGFELEGASDFKLLDRRAVNAFLSMDERNVFFRGMTAWIGFKKVSVPFEVAERSEGKTSWSLLRLSRLATNALTGFSAVPLHIVTLTGVLFLLFAFVLALQTLWVYLSGHAVTGFATVILLLLIIGSVLMFSLGVIGEYLARIYEEVKRRPRYIIAERVQSAGMPGEASGEPAASHR